MVLQMETQKVLYEEKALVALQRATQDKTEAVGKAATLQVKDTAASRSPVPCLHGTNVVLGARELPAHVCLLQA